MKRHWLRMLYDGDGAIDAGGRIGDVFGPATVGHELDRDPGAVARDTSSL